jgi:hypothetical protein
MATVERDGWNEAHRIMWCSIAFPSTFVLPDASLDFNDSDPLENQQL